MNNEKHPWMKGFTIGTLIAGVITAWAALAIMSSDSSSAGGGLLALLAAILMIWGAIWSLKKSGGFKKWSTLSGGQKALATLLMFPGFYAGIAVIAVIAVIKSEVGRNS